MNSQKEHASRQKDAHEFIMLSERHQKLPSHDPRKDHINDKLKELSEKYLEDKTFLHEIKSSHSIAAAERMAHEIKLREQTISRNQNTPGIER